MFNMCFYVYRSNKRKIIFCTKTIYFWMFLAWFQKLDKISVTFNCRDDIGHQSEVNYIIVRKFWIIPKIRWKVNRDFQLLRWHRSSVRSELYNCTKISNYSEFWQVGYELPLIVAQPPHTVVKHNSNHYIVFPFLHFYSYIYFYNYFLLFIITFYYLSPKSLLFFWLGFSSSLLIWSRKVVGAVAPHLPPWLLQLTHSFTFFFFNSAINWLSVPPIPKDNVHFYGHSFWLMSSSWTWQ